MSCCNMVVLLLLAVVVDEEEEEEEAITVDGSSWETRCGGNCCCCCSIFPGAWITGGNDVHYGLRRLLMVTTFNGHRVYYRFLSFLKRF